MKKGSPKEVASSPAEAMKQLCFDEEFAVRISDSLPSSLADNRGHTKRDCRVVQE